MALFNTFDIAGVVAEAQQHNNKMLADDLQPYNDMLFKLIADNIKTQHDFILERFKTNIKTTPGFSKVVSVPLWNYNVRYFFTNRQKYWADFATLNYMERVNKAQEAADQRRLHEDNGWHWTIGAMSPVQWLEEETSWRLRPVPVDLVVRKTDLLQRLSNLFDTDMHSQPHVWVTREYCGRIYEDDHCEVQRIALTANFYVGGIAHQTVRTEALKRTALKYAARVDEEEDFLSPRVVLTGPPPQTPPSSPVRPPTPRAPRRPRCESCDYQYDSE